MLSGNTETAIENKLKWDKIANLPSKLVDHFKKQPPYIKETKTSSNLTRKLMKIRRIMANTLRYYYAEVESLVYKIIIMQSMRIII